LVAAACTADRPLLQRPDQPVAVRQDIAGPSLRLVDTVVLVETDSLQLGRPGQQFAVDDLGALYVPDQLQDHVVRFGPSGVPQLVYGRHGRGPGELAAIAPTVVIDTFVVQFHSMRQVAVYSRTNGKFLTGRIVRGFGTSIAKSAGQVWIGVFDLESHRGVVHIPTTRLFGLPLESDFEVLPATAAPFPDQYARFPGLEIYNWVSVAPFGPGAVVGFAGGTNDLYVADTAGGVTDTLVIPIARRRGVSPGALSLLRSRAQAEVEKQIASASALQGLWPAPDGRVVIWYEDNSVRGTRPGHPGQFTGRAYLSLLSADGRMVCVDVEVPFPGSHWPRLAFARDTVYALDQVVPDIGPPRVYSVVRRYALDDKSCKWLSTKPEFR
jgi:hypothetical protein